MAFTWSSLSEGSKLNKSVLNEIITNTNSIVNSLNITSDNMKTLSVPTDAKTGYWSTLNDIYGVIEIIGDNGCNSDKGSHNVTHNVRVNLGCSGHNNTYKSGNNHGHDGADCNTY